MAENTKNTKNGKNITASTINWIREDDKRVKRAARNGNPHAAFELAQRLMVGRGNLERDPYAAFAECEFAARRGVVGAQLMLGYCYVMGLGVMVDAEKAIDAFKSAARGGNAVALYNLAVCYAQGFGVPEPKKALAAKLMLRSARAGYAKARVACARHLLLEGRSEGERAIALRWLAQAARGGDARAYDTLVALKAS